MGVVATWTYQGWLKLFPEFASVPQAQVVALEQAVVEASLVRNDGGGPVSNPNTQLALLNFATAHVVFLLTRAGSGPGNGAIVGQITSASEGSVSVATSGAASTPNSAYWAQSQYGITLWQMLAPYRTMRYIPGPGALCGTGYGGYYGGWGNGAWLYPAACL